eukprot:3641195-Rhodomonas_salina.1
MVKQTSPSQALIFKQVAGQGQRELSLTRWRGVDRSGQTATSTTTDERPYSRYHAPYPPTQRLCAARYWRR